jgi:hypothetical protein
MSKELEELYELEKELQEKMKDHYIPTKNKDWIPEKEFLKKQLEKKKSSKNPCFYSQVLDKTPNNFFEYEGRQVLCRYCVDVYNCNKDDFCVINA